MIDPDGQLYRCAWRCAEQVQRNSGDRASDGVARAAEGYAVNIECRIRAAYGSIKGQRALVLFGSVEEDNDNAPVLPVDWL